MTGRIARALPALALALGACSHPAEAPTPLAVRVAGCAELTTGPTCALGETRDLVLWVTPRSQRELIVTVDDETSASVQEHLDDGTRVRLTAPASAERLRLVDGERSFELALERLELPASLTGAVELRRQGELAAARDGARELTTSAEAEHRARAFGLLARIHLSEGDVEAASIGLERSFVAARDEGLVSVAVLDAVALAYTLRSRRYQLDAARAALDAVTPLLARSAHGEARVLYHRALIERDAGDSRAALRLFERGQRAASNLGQSELESQLGQARGRFLFALGREAEGLAVLDGVAELHDDPCHRAAVRTNRAWLRLLAAERGRGAVPTDDLELALALQREGCPDPARVQNARLNLALGALLEGRLDDARSELTAAGEAGATPPVEVAAWRLDIEANIALRDGRAAAALASFEELSGRAAVAAPPAMRWRAALGRGRALHALGRLEEATLAFSGAEAALDIESRTIPLGGGRDSFAGSREESAQHLVATLLARQQTEAALVAARRSRSRSLRTLHRRDRAERLAPEERRAFEAAAGEYRRARAAMASAASEAWQLPLDELAAHERAQRSRRASVQRALDSAFHVLQRRGEPDSNLGPDPAEGELVLMHHPVPGGLVGFAWTRAGIRTTTTRSVAADEPPAALAATLLAPFARELRAATQVRVVSWGALRSVDFHALPFGDGVLLDHAPVVYGVDVPRGPAARPGPTLVVADPTGDLAGARREGALAASLLGGTALVADRATHGAVLDALGEASTLYYAGHGEAAGRGGWRSALPLAAGGALEIGDILALRSAPSTVVLSGCETGRTAESASVATLGLGQAFVTSGSQKVVVVTRRVPDSVAEGFAASLLTGQGPIDASRFRAAALLLRDAPGTQEHWASYRLLVP